MTVIQWTLVTLCILLFVHNIQGHSGPPDTHEVPPWSVRDVPNPRRDVWQCGRDGKSSWVCDPELILSKTEADTIDRAVQSFRQTTGTGVCNCDNKDDCRRTPGLMTSQLSQSAENLDNIYGGWQPGILILSEINLAVVLDKDDNTKRPVHRKHPKSDNPVLGKHRDGEKHHDSQKSEHGKQGESVWSLKQFAQHIRQKSWNFGVCEDDFLILISVKQGLVYTDIGFNLQTRLPLSCAARIYQENYHYFRDNDFSGAIWSMLKMYGQVLNGHRKCQRDVSISTYVTGVGFGLLIIIGIFLFRRRIRNSATCCSEDTCIVRVYRSCSGSNEAKHQTYYLDTDSPDISENSDENSEPVRL